MLKLSRNGIGVLTSQYRSVLKKCALLNLIAAGALAFASPAHAEAGTNIASLDSMGTQIAVNETDYTILYVTPADHNTTVLFSGDSIYRSWITSEGLVRIGRDSTGAYYETTVSNKHSMPKTDGSSDVLPEQGGGVLANHPNSETGIAASATFDGVTFENNSVTEFKKWDMAEGAGVAAGGVAVNTGKYDSSSPQSLVNSKKSIYQNNYTMQFLYADGGALYNSLATEWGGYVGLARMESTEDTFRYNHVGNEDMADSIYQVVQAAAGSVEDEITQVWYDMWQGQSSVAAHHPNGVSQYARGGAIFNSGDFTITTGTFEHNYATAESAYGGAIHNSDRTFFGNSVKAPDSILTFVGTNKFIGNSALAVANDDLGQALGGAISNEATIVFDRYATDAFGSTTDLTFDGNYAISGLNSQGGAIYNRDPDGAGKASIRYIRNAEFTNNYAETTGAPAGSDTTLSYGGAIANTSVMVINDATFKNNTAIAKDGFARGYSGGGAIYNEGKLGFGMDPFEEGESDSYVPENIVFENNSAKGAQAKGGAILNNGATIVANIEKGVIFSGNQDSSPVSGNLEAKSGGGAIYGAAKSTTTFNLSGSGYIHFSKYGYDNVKMDVDDVIYFIGDNAAPYERSASTMSTSAANDEDTKVDLGATFTGTGTYYIQNTNLNLIDGGTGTGYIDFYPSIKMSDSVVDMGGTNSYMYLSSNNDTLKNNDFTLNNTATLYYADYDATYSNFALGNYIDNAGVIAYDDKPDHENSIAKVVYPTLSTSGDSDIKIANTLVNRGTVTTAIDNYITPRIHIGTLESANGSIYINTDNDSLIRTDSIHKLIEEPAEGYEYGSYFGQHYDSEVIVIDKEVSGTTKITLVDMNGEKYSQIKLDENQRIYFAQTQAEEGLSGFTWNVVNAVNDDYTIGIGHDEYNGVYDWFLYRGSDNNKLIPPEDMVAITIPRATLEQLRSFRLPIDKTNRGQCSCYQDNCYNSYCQYEPGSTKVRLWATPFYRQGTFEKPFETDFKLLGIDFGLDVQPTSSDLIGVFGSYRYGKYENDGNQKHFGDNTKYYSDNGGEFELKSMTAGLYYRKYIQNLYLLGAVYAGKLDGEIKADNGVKGSIDGKNIGAQAEIGYDIKATRRLTVTPSFRATYDYIKFDKGSTKNGKDISIGKVNSVEMEAALKFEYQFNNERQLPTTGYIKPSIIQTIPDGGKVKVGNKEYTKNLDNETLGRIEVGADANLTTRFSVGVFGNYTFGSSYDAWGVGGNLRYTW